MLLSLVLYGSRARGDYRAKSDVDLLGVIEEGLISQETSAGGTSMYHYPAELLKDKSRTGDLFVLHLIKEGIVLHDTLGYFQTIREQFKFKKSYSDEILDASLIIKFIGSRHSLLGRKDARSKLVWAVRTILIARSAEDEEARFSSASLYGYSRVASLRDVIDDRNNIDGDTMLRVANKVLRDFGSNDQTLREWPLDKAEQRKLLRQRGGMAYKTVNLVQPPFLRKISEAAKNKGRSSESSEYIA